MNEKGQAVQRLIRWHFEVSPNTVEAYYFSDESGEQGGPVRLLEVDTAAVETGYVDIFGFAPAEDFGYPLATGVVTPHEMQQIREGLIKLPDGWDLKRASHFTRDELVHANAA